MPTDNNGLATTTVVDEPEEVFPFAGEDELPDDVSPAPENIAAGANKVPAKVLSGNLDGVQGNVNDKILVRNKLVYPHLGNKANTDTSPKGDPDEGIDDTVDHITNTASFLTSSAGIFNAAYSDKKNLENGDDVTNFVDIGSNLLSLGSGSLSATMGVMNTIRDVKAYNKVKAGKNERRKSQAGYSIFNSVMGTASGLLQTGGAVSGLAGDLGARSGAEVGSYLGLAGSVFDVAGSIGSIAGAKKNSAAHQAVADEINASISAGDDRIASFTDSDYKKARRDYKNYKERTGRNDKTSRSLKKAKNTAKAKWYAMRMARDHNENKAAQESKRGNMAGIFGTVSSLLSFGGSLGSILSSGPTSGYVGGIFGAVSSLWKGLGKYVDSKSKDADAKADKKNKDSVMDTYITEKMQKIRDEIKNDPRINAMNLSDSVVKKIAYARLGADVDLSSDESQITPDVYNAAYNRVVLKRANNIMKSSRGDRNNMLKALGLPQNASLEEVAEMLGYEK